MIKILTVIGARPQFVKAAAVSSVFAEKGSDVQEILVHTGQHYDKDMSEIFFNELHIPKEKYNLNIGSGSHGDQTGRMLSALEKVVMDEKPDMLLIYGDTNSTLAGALVASKLHIPCAHVEAGMRSFNRMMPEEINRVVSDHVCQINFCSCDVAMKNLANEGRAHTGVLVGDVMYDCALKFAGLAAKLYAPFEKFQVKAGNYVLMTCHRAENTDDPERLKSIINAAGKLSAEMPVLFPIHPRTKNFIEKYSLTVPETLKLVPPVGYLEMVLLEKSAGLILTDSGGVQKEAFFYDVPCVTMRDETEWVETVECGWNILTGASYEKILDTSLNFLKKKPAKSGRAPYGDGHASEKILAGIKNYLKK